MVVPGKTPIGRTVIDVSDLTPLSSDQERLWLRRYLFPDWGNESPVVVRLGPVSPAAVCAACSALLRRHPTLRTIYPTTGGLPAQQVLPPTRFAVTLVDLSRLPPRARQAVLRTVVVAEAERPFELDTGPVIRVQLVRLDVHDHVLVSGVHHIAVDPWSIVLLGEDLMALTMAAASGRPDRRPAPASTYLDYVAWLQRRRTSLAVEGDHRFWRERLAGIAAVELPLDRPRPRRLTTAMLVHAVDLPAEVSELLRATARSAGVTTFAALLACFTALVHRLSGAERFAVMTVPAGRVRPEFASVVGLFTGDVVVCCDASGDPTVAELLGRVRDSVLDTFEHPEPAFNELAARLDPDRSLVPHPLRQLGVVLHNRRPPEVELTRVDLPAEPIVPGDATADVWLDVFDSGSGPMRMRLELAEPLFTVATGRLIAERLTTLIDSAMAEPEQRLSALPIGVARSAPDDRHPEIGGVSVDLAAVERTLRAHLAVADVAVAVRQCRTTADVTVAQVVCWVVAELAHPADPADLADLITAVTGLPTSVVAVREIPRDDSGAVCLDALELPVLGQRPSGGVPVPATPTEEAVAQLYREVLGVTDVGRLDSFFVLGGTSMLVCRLGAYLADRLGVEVALYDLVLRPRVVDVASTVDSARRTASSTGATAMSDRHLG